MHKPEGQIGISDYKVSRKRIQLTAQGGNFMGANGKRRAGGVLVIDVGGTNVKLLATGRKEPLKIPSGTTLTAKKMVELVKKATQEWSYDRISLGYPGPVVNERPLHDPHNLGPGWMGFDFEKAFGCPVKVINDAAMQALGSYRGGRMLFLGLGTGLGSAMVVDGVVEPTELAHLPYRHGKTYEDYLGLRGLEQLGKKKWRKHAAKVVEKIKVVVNADYVVLGGGNSKKLKTLPRDTQLGANENAFRGGFRMWEKDWRRRELLGLWNVSPPPRQSSRRRPAVSHPTNGRHKRSPLLRDGATSRLKTPQV
jgi:polyphosphate glucokinase